MSKSKVLITGASKGIGLEITKMLLNEGYFVYGVGRSEIDFEHESFQYFQKDLKDSTTFDFLEKEIPKLDVLINNAGVGTFRPLENLKQNEIQEMIQTNLTTPILLTQTFLEKLRNSEGHIINIGSQSALKGEKMGTVYCATKFGMRGFTESLWNELRKHHVKVTLVNPGVVDSSFFDDKDFVPEKGEYTALKPSDIAKVVLDILSMREGSVVCEIEVLPQKHSLKRK